MRPKHDIALRTLGAMLERNAAEDPERPFLIDEAGTLSRAETALLARRLAGAFGRLGVVKGETVAIMLENRRELLASWFGLAYRGAVEVPISPASVGEHLIHTLNHSRCETAVVQSDCLPRIEEVAGRLEWLKRLVVVGDATAKRLQTVPWSALQADGAEAGPAEVGYSDPVAVLYTSGATGPAKGVVVSQGHHYTNGYQPTALFELDPSDTIYVCLPLHHNMAQGYGVWPAIVSGAVLRLAKRFDAEAFWPDVRAHGATAFPFVGAMLVLLAKRAEQTNDRENPLRLGFGVPIPASLHEPFEERFDLRLVHCYGSTEATIVTWQREDDRVVGSVGRALPGYDVGVLDADDQPLPAGQLGQICTRPHDAYSMFSGYFRDPDRTARAFRNLWFHTGDRGWLDEAGNLWFSDRLDDVIRRLGETVSSWEVEQAVLAHPAVQLAAAFGVPSELVEEEVMVTAVVRDGFQLSAADLRTWCAARLPRYATPRFIELVSSLPMTSTGKIEKFKLRERGVSDATDDGRAGAAGPAAGAPRAALAGDPTDGGRSTADGGG